MEPQAGSDLADLIGTDPGGVWGFQVPGFAGLLGVLLLALVLAYTKQGPWWSGPAMLAGALAGPIFPVGTIVCGALYLAGAGIIGLRMLRMSDEEWAAPAVQPAGKVATTR